MDNKKIELSAGKKIFIRKGVYHSTIAGKNGLNLIEIENPRNKFDLIRHEDTYGREMQKYETFTSDEICIADLVLYKNYMLRNTDAMNEFSFIVGQFQDIERQLNEQYKLMFTVVLSLKHYLADHIHLIDGYQINNPAYQDQQSLFILKK